MNHTPLRLDSGSSNEIPDEVKRDEDLLAWSEHVQITAMRTVCAGVLASTGSLDRAASVLDWSGFTVPAGYFNEDHPAYDLLSGDEAKLRAFVEEDEEDIRSVIGTEVFRLAAIGGMLDKALPVDSPSTVQKMKQTERRE